MRVNSVHPFPARMGPDIVADVVRGLPRGANVLDPMCGSGTVLRYAAEEGLHSQGFDLDPLAVIISSCWAAPPPLHALLHDFEVLMHRAEEIKRSGVLTPAWHDAATQKYAQFWFGDKQREDLSALSQALLEAPTSTQAALQTAVSRVIITKDRGASLARDVSHSRPHRVKDTNDYDVFTGVRRAMKALAGRLVASVARPAHRVARGDARTLCQVDSESVDCVITSPPYLNAIDYMRGHRLSLIWFGLSLAETSSIRASTVGAERSAPGEMDFAMYVDELAGTPLASRYRGWLQRYALDAGEVVRAISRVCRSTNARVVMVVGNSVIRTSRIDNARIYADLLAAAGFSVTSATRQIPSANRYLPIQTGSTSLSKRMRDEYVLTATR